MNENWSVLEQSFLEDHRLLTQGFQTLIDAIQRGDWAIAKNLALELDRRFGPHVEFQERFLYPIVEDHHGEAYTARLFDEHVAAARTLVRIQGIDPASPPTRKDREAIREGLQKGLDHAASCATLLSHLEVLSPEEQQRLRRRLDRLRVIGHRWSELHPHRNE